MTVELTHEVWDHGLFPLPGARVSEESLLALRSPHGAVTLDEWASLSREALGLSGDQAEACMQLAGVLGDVHSEATGGEARVPLATLLLLLWTNHTNSKLKSVAATASRSQAASAVHPSLMSPVSPRACGSPTRFPSAPDSPLGSFASPLPVHQHHLLPPTSPTLASSRSLAVSARLGQVGHPSVARSHPECALTAERRKLVVASLRALLLLAAAGSERLYASDVDQLGLLLRPQRTTAHRLAAHGKRPGSLSDALGLWESQPAGAVHLSLLLPALAAALTPVRAVAAGGAAGSSADPLPAGTLFVDLDVPAPRPAKAPLGSAAGTVTPSRSVCGAAGTGARPPSLLVPSDDDVLSPSPASPSATAAAGSGVVERVAAAAQGDGAVLRLLGARRRTLVLRGGEEGAERTALQLIDCHRCQIYVLAPVRSLELVGCTGCTVVASAVRRVASLRHCERLTLLATTGALVAHSLVECSLQLACMSRPLLWGDNHRLTLAPFGTIYASLARHMRAAGLSTQLARNHWADPICCMPPSGGDAEGGGEACYTLLPPESYLPFHVPFDVPPAAAGGAGVPPVVELPAEYAAALAARAGQLRDFSEQLGALHCSKGVRSEVSATLQARFREWLVRTGNMRQVVELLAVQGAASAG